MYKRIRCQGRKCAVYKAGLCVKLPWRTFHWPVIYRDWMETPCEASSSAWRRRRVICGTYKKKAADFARKVMKLLADNCGKLPKKYQCNGKDSGLAKEAVLML